MQTHFQIPNSFSASLLTLHKGIKQTEGEFQTNRIDFKSNTYVIQFKSKTSKLIFSAEVLFCIVLVRN